LETGLLDAFRKEYQQLLNQELRALVEKLDAPSIIKESMIYSLEAGGKRIRPLLFLRL
jgi:geranylgeranyl diphosphate synthase type II